jgi:hypothetical protein
VATSGVTHAKRPHDDLSWHFGTDLQQLKSVESQVLLRVLVFSELVFAPSTPSAALGLFVSEKQGNFRISLVRTP